MYKAPRFCEHGLNIGISLQGAIRARFRHSDETRFGFSPTWVSNYWGILRRWSHSLTKSVFTPTYARFRELLIEARESVGLTQAQLAERLGRPQSYVSKFERGERRLDVVEFFEIAKALRIDPFVLLRDLTTGSQKHAR